MKARYSTFAYLKKIKNLAYVKLNTSALLQIASGATVINGNQLSNCLVCSCDLV